MSASKLTTISAGGAISDLPQGVKPGCGISEDVDLFTGKISLSRILAALPGRNGLGLEIGADYTSAVTEIATTKNIDAPTGVLGLGWSLSGSKIIRVSNNTGAGSDDQFFYIEDGSICQLIRTGTDTEGDIYAASGSPFWKIRYVKNKELWAVIKEDGTRYFFGGADSIKGRDNTSYGDSIEWKVKHGNWLGDSNSPENQQQYAAAWNISGIRNTWDDEVSFSYQQVKRYVSSVETAGRCWYTRSCLLKEIVGANGDRMEFVYSPKDASEYEKLHTCTSATSVRKLKGTLVSAHFDDSSSADPQITFTVTADGRSYSYSTEKATDKNVFSFDIDLAGDITSDTISIGVKAVDFDPLGRQTMIDTVFNNVTANSASKTYTNKSATATIYLSYVKGANRDADAYQDQYETDYLKLIVMKDKDGNVISSVLLNYAMLGTNHKKRVLQEIVYFNPSGAQIRPSERFSYYGMDANDGVSAASVFKNGALYGSMKSSTKPAGGASVYTYSQQALGATSRWATFNAPGDNWVKPRTYFGLDYAVVVWESKDGSSLNIKAYTWNGKWIEYSLGLHYGGSYNLLTASDWFAFVSGRETFACIMDKKKAGAWITASLWTGSRISYESFIAEHFAAVLNRATGAFQAYARDGEAFREYSDNLRTSNDAVFSLCASQNCIFTVSADKGNRVQPELRLYKLNEQKQWNAPVIKSIDKFLDSGLETIILYPSDTFVVLQAHKTDSLGRSRYRHFAYTWPEGFDNIVAAELGSEIVMDSINSPSVRVTVVDRNVIIDTDLNLTTSLYWNRKHVYTYMGNGWLYKEFNNDRMANNYFGYDTLSTTSNGKAQLWQFDPNLMDWQPRLDPYPDGNPTLFEKIWLPVSIALDIVSSFFPITIALDVTIGVAMTLIDQVVNMLKSCSLAEQAGRYFLQNNILNYQSSDGKWQPIGELSQEYDRIVSEKNINGFLWTQHESQKIDFQNTQIANGFIAYSVDIDHYTVVLQPDGVRDSNHDSGYPRSVGHIQMLKNGNRFGDPLAIPDGYSIKLTGDADETGLVGSNAVAAYSGGDKLIKARSIGLYYVAGAGLTTAVSDYVVSSVAMSDGCDTLFNHIEYDAATAACTPDASTGLYNKATVYLSGLSRKKSAANGKIESYYYLGAGGTPPFMPDNQDMSYPALFKGLNYHTRIYDAGNNLVSSETDTYSVFQPSLVRGVKGYYVRPIRAGSFRDGATSEVTTVYNDHGLPSESEAANFNSNGGSQRIRLRNVYASSVYPDLAQQNNLTAVYQTTTIVNGVATSSRAAAWARCAGAGTGKQGFNYPKWAAQNTYRALAANAGSLPAGAAPDPTLWLKDSTVLSRDSRGLVQEFTAASQLRSTVFDSPGRYAVAGFVNASPYQGQAGYIGFEAYESLSQWGMTGEILNNAGPRNTGYGVLGRGKNPAAFIRPRDYNPRPGSKYLVSAWVNMRPKGTGGLGAHIGFAQLAPGIKNEDRKVIAAPETSQWQYIEYVTASPDPARVPYVQCDGLIDDFIFRPLDSAFSAVVYHPVHQVPLAVIGLNGDVVRTFYDDNLEPVASVAADGNLLNYSARRYSRDGAADFDAANPNMALTLQPRSGGKYPGRILNGELPLTQAVPGDCVNYGAVAKFARRKDVTLDLTVADIRITGRADGFYCKAGNAPEQKLCDPGPTRLMVLKLGPKALVIADLKLLAVLPSAAAGPVVFASKGGYEQDPDWRFDNAAVLFEPRIDVTYMDGYGRPIQMQTIEGNGESKVVTQTVYDGYGAPAVTTKPIRVNGSSWSYVPDVVASIDWTSGIMRGKAADYCRANRVETQNDNDWQYPYAWSRRESSPLARKVRGGAPGSNYSFASNYAVRVSFDRNDPNITALRNALSLPDNPYLQETSYYPLSDTRQTPVARLFDLQNNLIAVRSGSSESPIMSKNILDISPKDGTVSAQLIPPNSFNYGGHPSYEFRNYEGRLARRDDIDSGTKQYIYERATGLLRFMMDSAGAALQPDRINYFKYDSLNRITEAGYVGSNWDIGTLQNLADTDPKWPLTGVWRTRWSYDQAADQNCDYMKGRLASILSRGDAGKTVTDSFRYDIRGRAVSASRAAGAYDGKTRVIGYSYDNFGNVLGIAYPDNALQLVYGYNRNGQLLSIGIAGAPQLYASYSYNVDGSINSAALNNGKITRSFGYDFQGKLVKIDMQSLFKENIKWHTPTGIVEGGRIAQIDLSGSIISAPYSIAFDYDEHGRLTKAASDQAHKNLEVGTVGQASFDANGNILASSRGAAACAYQYIRGANKIMQCNSDSYHFNANGDLLDGRGMAFTYDPCSGLVTSINCDNLALTYSYSGSGQRVLKTATGSANYRRLYIHGLNALPLMEETSTDKTYYIYGPEDLLAIEM